MLFGVKYLIGALQGDLEKNYPIYDEGKKIYINTYALSLGVGVSEDVLNKINFQNPFDYQNKILKNISGLDIEVYTKQKEKINKETENVEKNGRKYTKLNKEEDAKIIYEIEVEETGNLYLYLVGKNITEIYLNVNNKPMMLKPVGDTNKMIYIGSFNKNDNVKVEIELKGDELTIDNELFYIENEDNLKKYYDILKNEQVDLREISGRKYEGKVNIKENDRYLLFTIPYDNGWTIKVDGEDAQKIEVMDTLMAVKIEEGYHDITLEFMPEGFNQGALISLLRNHYANYSFNF